MSRHPSPGPSHPSALPPHHTSLVSKQKQKPHPVGLAAGAEDVKYHAKYKDLKRKVKEIEADNDKLYFKVLQAKRSIQRMKLERAILYERLSAVPPSPEMRDRPLPPTFHEPPQAPPRSLPPMRNVRDNPSSMDPDPALVDYIRTHGNPRVAPGPDGRPVPVLDHPMAPSSAPPPHPSAAHSPRRTSSVHENMRHLPPISQQPPPPAQYEPSRSHSHSLHASPPMHHPPPYSSSSHDRQDRHERTKSHSSSRSRSYQGQPYGGPHQYIEPLPSVQHVMHSPPLAERERSRRHDMHEYSNSRGDSHLQGHSESPLVHMSPRAHSSDTRSSSRIHNHQRMGPGTYINIDEERHRDLERERDRDWERDRESDRSRDLGRSSREMASPHMHSPHIVHRSRQPVDRADYLDQRMTSRVRDDQPYYQEPSAPSNYPLLSRSGSPGSVSADGSSRPDSRTQLYDQDRARSSYRLRPVNQPNEDIDFVHEDGRSQSRDRGGSGGGGNYPMPEQSHPSMGSRKRNRNDMDVDSENDVGEGPPGGGHYSSSRLAEDRSSKRYHREQPRRSSDNHEDSRMGPS